MRTEDPASGAVLKGLFEGLSFGCLLDLEGKVLLVNRAALETTSLQPEALIGCSFSETPWWAPSPESRVRLERAFRGALHGEQSRFHADLEMRERSQLMEVTLTPIRDEQVVTTVVVSATDIGERQAIATQLEESENRFREVTHSASFLFWMSDPDGEFDFVNGPWLEFTGRAMERELGQGWRSVLHPDDRRHCIEEYASAIRERRPFAVECRFRSGRGVDRWFVFRGGPRFRSDGTLAGFMGVCTEIEDQKHLEAQLRASLDEKDLLLKEVHHRVKNNLQVVSSLLRLQSRLAGSTEAVRILEESEHRIRAMAMVHEAIYRSNVGRVGADEYLESLVRQLESLYAPPDARIVVRSRIANLELDLDQAIPLALVVNELVSNALKHAFPDGADGQIEVVLEVRAHELTLEVRDDGVGFPPDLDWRDTDSLGMRLVYLLSEQMGATVEVEVGGVRREGKASQEEDEGRARGSCVRLRRPRDLS